jgi:hypothetical protein
MDSATERRLLQIAVGFGSLVPILAGGAGMLSGPEMVGGGAAADLDSHMRYLSGLLFGIGLGFASCRCSCCGNGGSRGGSGAAAVRA